MGGGKNGCWVSTDLVPRTELGTLLTASLTEFHLPTNPDWRHSQSAYGPICMQSLYVRTHTCAGMHTSVAKGEESWTGSRAGDPGAGRESEVTFKPQYLEVCPAPKGPEGAVTHQAAGRPA